MNYVTPKLNQAIGILSKLRNNTSLKTEDDIPFSFFFPPTVSISAMGAKKLKTKTKYRNYRTGPWEKSCLKNNKILLGNTAKNYKS